MALRNFWQETEIDGRNTVLTGGPRSKTGGLRTNIYVRDEGSSVLACTIRCTECDGDLIVDIYDKNGCCVYSDKTKR